MDSIMKTDGSFDQALNRIGLRVVLDVVYNHLYSSGAFGVNSVLDKVCPRSFLLWCSLLDLYQLSV